MTLASESAIYGQEVCIERYTDSYTKGELIDAIKKLRTSLLVLRAHCPVAPYLHKPIQAAEVALKETEIFVKEKG